MAQLTSALNCVQPVAVSRYPGYDYNGYAAATTALDFTESGDHVSTWVLGIQPGNCGAPHTRTAAQSASKSSDTTAREHLRSGRSRRFPAAVEQTPRRLKMRRITAVAVCGVAGLALLAGTAHAKGSTYLPAPAYPNSKLAIDVAGKPRAGKVVKVAVSGSNAPFEIGYPGSGDYLAYQLDVFAQNGKVVPNCPRSFTEELQNEINLGVARIAQGFPEGYYGPFSTPIRFQTRRPGAQRRRLRLQPVDRRRRRRLGARIQAAASALRLQEAIAMRALMGATIARTLMDQKQAPRARPRRRRRGLLPAGLLALIVGVALMAAVAHA